MSEALNAEAVLKSIVELRESIAESRKDTAELRERMDEQWKRSEQATAELRESIAEQGKRSEQATAELRESIAEQGRRIDEQGRRMDKMLEEFAEARAELKENNRRLSETTHEVGKLSNKLGSIVEKIVLPGIVDKFNEKGFKFDSVSANVEFLNEKKDGNIAEVDALLENGKFVIAVETKTELTVKDVNTHIKRLQALHKIPRFKGKKIYGAFSTAISEKKKPVSYALDKGFYVLQQPDVMAVRILDFPKGRSAKAW